MDTMGLIFYLSLIESIGEELDMNEDHICQTFRLFLHTPYPSQEGTKYQIPNTKYQFREGAKCKSEYRSQERANIKYQKCGKSRLWHVKIKDEEMPSICIIKSSCWAGSYV